MNIKEYAISVNSKWEATFQDKFEESLLLFLTERCNLACQNCFMLKKMGINELDFEVIKKIIEANPRFKKIDLMGGEPLLYKELYALIKFLKDNKKDVSIYTNGILLDKIPSELQPLRVCISFHELESIDPSRKPLFAIADKIENFYLSNNQNKLKLILLLDKNNYMNALEFINKIEERFPWLTKITLGLMRNEDDYWNDFIPGVLSFEDYAKTIQFIVNNYQGKLNIDVFLKGVLSFNVKEEDNEYDNRTNRFKCVFADTSYSECLYNAHLKSIKYLDETYELPSRNNICSHTLKKKCIADKIRLVNRG